MCVGVRPRELLLLNDSWKCIYGTIVFPTIGSLIRKYYDGRALQGQGNGKWEFDHECQSCDGQRRYSTCDSSISHNLSLVMNERQNDWNQHSPNVECACSRSISRATGITVDEVFYETFPRSPHTVI